MRALATALLAALVALALAAWRSPTPLGILPLLAAAAIAGLPAAAVTIMRESVIEDFVKAGLAIALGILILLSGGPAWIGWPVMVGPFMGMLGVNRVTRPPGTPRRE